MLSQSSNLPPHDLDELARHYLAFMDYAFNEDPCLIRNFLSYTGEWLEKFGPEDSQGRTLLCLGGFIAKSNNVSQVACARELFQKAYPMSLNWTSPRAWSYAILGLTGSDRHNSTCPKSFRTRENLADRLVTIWQGHSHYRWKWFESSLSYCIARIPQSLIAAGMLTRKERMIQCGLDSLEWLWIHQINPAGVFDQFGCSDPYCFESNKTNFDQQSLEVCLTVGACFEALNATNDPIWQEREWTTFNWFQGEHHLDKQVYDPETLGYFDGVQVNGLNLNQGAESTVSFLIACAEMRSVNRSNHQVRARSKTNASWQANTKTII